MISRIAFEMSDLEIVIMVIFMVIMVIYDYDDLDYGDLEIVRTISKPPSHTSHCTM